MLLWPSLDKLNVETAVHFSQKLIPVDQMTDMLKGMHLGVISNRRNIATDLMLPVKMLEYIALGIPVVAPELEGIQYYFTGDMVSFFKPGSVDSLAEAIETLYRKPDKRNAQARRATEFLIRYGWDSHKKDLIDLYNSIGGRH